MDPLCFFFTELLLTPKDNVKMKYGEWIMGLHMHRPRYTYNKTDTEVYIWIVVDIYLCGIWN